MIVENTSAVPTWAPNQQERGATHPSAFGPQSMYYGSHSKFCHGVYGDLCIHDGYFQLQERYIRLRLMQVNKFTGKCPGISSRDTRSIVDLGENQHRLSCCFACISPLDLIRIDRSALYEYVAESGVFHFFLTSSSHGGRKPFPLALVEKSQGGLGLDLVPCLLLSEPIPVDRGIRYFGHPDLGGGFRRDLSY